MHTLQQPSPTNNIPIYLRGRVIGRVEGDVFHKVLSKSRHFLRRPPAIAFDVSTLRDARQAGADRVRIVDRDSGDVYEATIDEIEEHGFPVRRGYGDQVALSLGRWAVNGQAPTRAHAFDSNQERKDAQPSLFDFEGAG